MNKSTHRSIVVGGENQNSRRASDVVLWPLFFLICLGLGYAGLNRYDPRQKLPDAALYAQMAASGPHAVSNQLRFRVLVPFLAREVCKVVSGHTRTWDPLMFSFLIVNASFAASTAFLLFRLGAQMLGRSVALLGAALYLLNFAIANAHLAGLVDSAEAFFLTAVVASLFFEGWPMLPVIGAIGTLAKESFVPFSIVVALTWCLTSQTGKPRRPLAWVGAMAAAQIIALVVLQSLISRHAMWPWQFMSEMNSQTSYAQNLWHSFFDTNSWYILVWLLPLGLPRLKDLPRTWVRSAGVASASALLLNAYHSTVGGGGGGIGRYVFDIAGPLLSLSAAAYLSGFVARSSAEAAN